MELKRLPPGVFARFNIEELKPLYDLSTAMETKSVPSTALVISPDDTLDGYQSMNSRLAGNIARQIELGEDYRDLIDEILDPLLREHIETYDYFKEVSILDGNSPLRLTQAWMVLQEKYEFNPVHAHSGVFSFVIWLKIPYTREDELNHPISVNSNTPCAGQFSYFTLDNFFAGNIATHFIETGKELEGCAFLFPSKMNHCVYPFYTSDEYRISIAGNYRFKV